MNYIKRIVPIVAVFVAIGLFWHSCTRKPVTMTAPLTETQAKALAAETAELAGGYVGLWNDTGSMRPTISEHTILVFVRDWENTGVGDIVDRIPSEPIKGGGTYVHRIVGERGGDYVTQGDGNMWRDPGVMDKNHYLGTVIAQFHFNPSL